mmetsp:Transcript_56744/g.149036  ORF Transcript_56744/g.149036 Transcript_56744/m.149036 type:complete len:103 (+) Transcript_56744:223-531(+)|eukprot:69386-Prymnesium_polylepis.1
MCCCTRFECPVLCKGKRVVNVPFKTCPPPCCCLHNKVESLDNCFGLCGQVLGNPLVYTHFNPQPKDAEAFVKAATEGLNNALERKTKTKLQGMPPKSDEMER